MCHPALFRDTDAPGLLWRCSGYDALSAVCEQMRNHHSAALTEQRLFMYCGIGPGPVLRACFFPAVPMRNGRMVNVGAVERVHAEAEINAPAMYDGVASVALHTAHPHGGVEMLPSEIIAQQQQYRAHLAQSLAQEKAMKQRVFGMILYGIKAAEDSDRESEKESKS